MHLCDNSLNQETFNSDWDLVRQDIESVVLRHQDADAEITAMSMSAKCEVKSEAVHDEGPPALIDDDDIPAHPCRKEFTPSGSTSRLVVVFWWCSQDILSLLESSWNCEFPSHQVDLARRLTTTILMCHG